MHALQSLKLWQKFSLMGLLALALCAPLTALLLRTEWSLRTAAVAEREGMPAVDQLLKLLRHTQVHRGLTASALAGNAEAADKRKAQAELVHAALRSAQAALQSYPGGLLDTHRSAVVQQWQALHDDVAAGRTSAPESFKRHSALVLAQQALLADATDASGLILDPEAATYHLVVFLTDTMPRVTELLGQSRALGAAALQARQLSTDHRSTLQGNLAELAHLKLAATRHLDQTFAGDAAMAAELQPLRAQAEQAVSTAAALVQTVLQSPEAAGIESQAYFRRMTEQIDAQFAVADSGFKLLDQALTQRVDGSDRRLAVAAAAIVLALLAGVALVGVVVRGTQRSVAAAEAALQALARGELNHAVPATAGDECGHLAQGLGRAMQELAGMVHQIKQSGEALGTASAQIASGTADLSTRTEHSAGGLQNAAASLEQLTATVHQNAASARAAAELAQQANGVASDGGHQISQLVETMQQISGSAQRIAEITGLIDGIAFQTNILALNAAVEAARAGEQGRGFAVVASEVRALAQRAGQAARDIRGLITTSVDTVAGGERLVADTRQTMAGIVSRAEQLATVVGEIEHATSEQAAGIGMINGVVGQLEQSTQQNAALVEESTAAAESMRQQAERLVQVVGRFRVDATTPA